MTKRNNNKDNNSVNNSSSDIEFEDVSYKDIVKVAKSLGLKANGKKESLLERIKEKLKKQNSPSPPPQTTSATTTTSISKEQQNIEILFWKTWRNIYIKRIIFSNLVGYDFQDTPQSIKPFRKGVYKYEQIISVRWLLKYGKIDLLKNKVKDGDYLVDFNVPISRAKGMMESNIAKSERGISIFKLVKDDREFYENLFKNYPQYFIVTPDNKPTLVMYNKSPSNTPIPIPNLIATANVSIENDNWVPFKLLLVSYKLEPTNKLIEYSIDNISPRCLIGLVKYFKKSSNNNNGTIDEIDIQRIWDKTIEKLSSSTIDFITSDIISILIEKLDIKPPLEMEYNCFNLMGIIIHSCTLNELLKSCYTLALLIENSESSSFNEFINVIGKNKNNSQKSNSLSFLNYFNSKENSVILTTDQIKEEINTFTNDELSRLIYNFNESNLKVVKFYKFLMVFTKSQSNGRHDYEYFKENLIFYKIKYQGIGYDLVEKELDFNPLEFGDFENFKKLGQYSQHHQETIIKNVELFNYCPNDHEKHLQFVNLAIQENKRNIKVGTEKLSVKNLIYLLVKFDKVELVQHVYNETCTTSIISARNKLAIFPPNLFSSIASCQMFDLLVGTCKLELQYNLNSALETEYGLMNHLKVKYNGVYTKLLQDHYRLPIKYNHTFNYSMESLLFIYRNINDFIPIYRMVDYWFHWSKFQLDLNDFIMIVENTPITEKYTWLSNKVSTAMNQYNWVAVNRPDDLLSPHGRCCTSATFERLYHLNTNRDLHLGDQVVILVAYYTNQLTNKLDSKNILKCGLLEKLAKIGDLKSLKTLIDHCLVPIKDRSFSYYNDPFLSILKSFAKYGRIDCFKFIIENYNFILVKCRIQNYCKNVLQVANTFDRIDLINYLINDLKF